MRVRFLVHFALALLVVKAMLLSTPAFAQSEEEKAAVLALNSEFYRAFRESDLKAMDAVWGKQGEIAVEHPSSWRLEGREAVMQSWAAILPNPPSISCVVEGISFNGGKATVLCNELLNPGFVRMKNVFHKEDGVWKMIYHGPRRDEGLV